jgi:hypothetical protein
MKESWAKFGLRNNALHRRENKETKIFTHDDEMGLLYCRIKTEQDSRHKSATWKFTPKLEGNSKWTIWYSRSNLKIFRKMGVIKTFCIHSLVTIF